MSIELRRPQFSGTDREKLQQMHSYIYQLVDQLQYAFETVETTESGGGTTIIQQTVTQSGSAENRPTTPEDAEATFAAIKNLIIKSGDIIDAYYSEIREQLRQDYEVLDRSSSIMYREEIEAEITKTAEATTQVNKKVETISSVYGEDGEAALIKKSTGYIRAGILNDAAGGAPKYGIEIGLISDNGTGETRKFARYASDRVVIYDQNGDEGAWLNDQKLHAHTLEAEQEFHYGRFVDEVDPMTKDVTTRWMEEV